MANHCPESFSSFKDVISISWFPYNWSQTLLCYVNGVKYSKWYSIAKGMTTFHDKNCFKTKKVKMQQNKKKQTLKSLSNMGIDSMTSGIALPLSQQANCMY